MAVYKEEKTGTWRAVYRYTDWNGERKQTQKRGFKTKREAQAWEREQVHKTSADLDMNFKSFVELYTVDMKTRLKENTWATKEHIIRTKLLPYFGKLKMCNITAQQIITWQNEMLNHKDENGKPYSPVDLKTVHNQLKPLDIVLLHTGAQKNYGRTEYRITGCGVGREATLWLLRQGVKVVGTDAWSWDVPLPLVAKEFAKTKDPSVIWEGHLAGMEMEYYQMEKMTNLDLLPVTGFQVICFPIKIKGGSAGWVRSIAVL